MTGIAGAVRDYGDIAGEAASCRAAAALFDFSFMHRARVAGPQAGRLVQSLTPRPLADLAPGRIAYALHVDDAGHVRADLTVWRLEGAVFEVYSGRADEIARLRAGATHGARVEDLTAETAIFAVQGPDSLARLAEMAPAETLRRLGYFAHEAVTVAGLPCRVGRLGYTGERGFEIVAPRMAGPTLWAALARRIRPAGFAAADILRIEAGFVLFANELAVPVTPCELGLARFAGGGAPPRARLVCFTASCDRDPVLFAAPRPNAFPPAPGAILVTSACRSEAAGGVLGLGYVAAAWRGDVVDPSGRFRDFREARLPYVDPIKRRPRGIWRDDLQPEDGGR